MSGADSLEPDRREPRPAGRPPGRHDGSRPSVSRSAGTVALTLGALGVVFGDIGTSPLYAMNAIFSGRGAVTPNQVGVYGVLSVVFWAITVVVSLKYVTFIMRVSNQGEGGIMALIALVRRRSPASRLAKATLVALGVFGAALFYGDGMITPAISVLSAVEGLEVAAPRLEALVVPITLVILTVLFAIQRFGTGAVGRLFGPVMVVWFAILAIVGAKEVLAHPEVLRALSPTYGFVFFMEEPAIAFVALASVVLAITGAEALYADMGHFGRPPIRRAWFFMVFPALILNYLGQGSLILRTPSAIDNPFFLLLPDWSRVAMVVLATAATVIASQAVISGAFSVTRQAVQLGFLPRLTIRHTSEEAVGQVYVPAVNWGLLIAVAALVIGFGSSSALAAAYGIAVTGTLAIDTVLFFVLVRVLFRKPLWLALTGAIAFGIVDLAFFSATLTKVLDGGWFPLTIAAGVFAVLITWERGREIVTQRRTAQEGSLRDFVKVINAMDPPIRRVPGTAVFLNPSSATTPIALRQNVELNSVLHEEVVILSVVTKGVPHVPESERLLIDDLGFAHDHITHVTAYFGFQDEPNVPAALRLCAPRLRDAQVDLESAIYFLSRVSIARTNAPGMGQWRKRLFITLSRNAASPVDFFGLPSERTVTMGSQISL